MLEVVRKALNSKLVSLEARDGGAVKQVNSMHSCGTKQSSSNLEIGQYLDVKATEITEYHSYCINIMKINT